MLLRSALRNLLRQRRRTLILLITVVLSLALLLVLTGLADGGHQAMADIGVRMGLGHVVVYPAGYRADPTLEHTIDDPAAIESAIAKLGPSVAHVAPAWTRPSVRSRGATSIGVTIS